MPPPRKGGGMFVTAGKMRSESGAQKDVREGRARAGKPWP